MTNKRCLVYETLGKVSDLQIVESNSSDGLMRLHGIFGVTGVKNNNNRIYDKKNYSQMVAELQKTIAECGCPGELEHPNSMNINLENVSHKIESIQMNEDGTITGTICLLDTPKGRIAKAIIEGGLPLYISSRAAGTMTNESGVNHVTLSTIKTYDLVGTPGFSQAKMTLKENQTLECLNESFDEGNVMYAIVEGDDDLLGDLDSDKSDESDEKKDDSEKEDKKKDDSKKEDTEDKDKEEKSEKKDNKNNDDKVNMNELKEAIDKLTDKVNSIEAELHVAKESLYNIPSINYDAIETWVTEEFAPKFKSEVTENINDLIETQVSESLDDSMGSFAEGVQEWVCKEFAPEVQAWVCEEFAPEVQNWVCEEFAPEVQNWVCEEFAPEVQNWITEEFAPEVQDWITEEFAPEVENWLVEEYSPEIQGWITEEFAPVIDGWINEEFAPEYESKINESMNTFLESQKAGRLDEIDNLLESIAQDPNADVNQIVEEQKAENKYKGIYVVEAMPAEYTPSWELLDEARQQEIIRISKMYDFTKPGVLESFWANVDFNKTTKDEKIMESNDNISSYHAGILARMKYLRKFA